MVMQINAGDTFEDRGHLYTIDRIYERNSEKWADTHYFDGGRRIDRTMKLSEIDPIAISTDVGRISRYLSPSARRLIG